MLKKILFYIFLLLLLSWGLQFFIYTGIRKNESGLFDKFNKIFHEENNYDVLFVGSSRAECHFNPKIFDSITGYNSYNIGISGSNNSFTYGIYKAYLSKSKAPKYAIMNIDYQFAHESSDTIYEFPRFFPYLDNEILFNELNKRDKRFFLFKYLPPYAIAFLGDKYFNIALRGYSNNPSSYDEQCYKGFQSINPLNYKDLENEDTCKYKAWILKENSDYLDSIISISKDKNIELIFVVSPLHKNGIKRVKNVGEVISQFGAIAQKNNILFMNYHLDSISNDDTNFADFYHMKNKGATLFSKKFSSDFIRSKGAKTN